MSKEPTSGGPRQTRREHPVAAGSPRRRNPLLSLLRAAVMLSVCAALLVILIGAKGRSFGGLSPDMIPDWALERAVALLEPSGDAQGPPRSFEVPPGESAGQLADRLAEAGLVRHPRLVRLFLRHYGQDRHIQAGSYTVPAGIALPDLVNALVQGQTQLVRVTIPEGWRAEQIADLLQRSGVAGRDEFLQLVYSSNRRLPLTGAEPLPSLEGFLFPDTYLVPPNYGAAAFVDLMLNTFQEKVGPELPPAEAAPQGTPGVSLSLREKVILASIVEREATVPEEWPIIAAIFRNRLAQDMPLEADPTVQYALTPQGSPELAAGYWKTPLTLEDLKLQSPYNTYQIHGLPPGPISNPGLGSLRAVLRPQSYPYLYFVAKPDGTHAFAVTFPDHQANVALYQ